MNGIGKTMAGFLLSFTKRCVFFGTVAMTQVPFGSGNHNDVYIVFALSADM